MVPGYRLCADPFGWFTHYYLCWPERSLPAHTGERGHYRCGEAADRSRGIDRLRISWLALEAFGGANPSGDYLPVSPYKQLRCCDHSLHDCDLLSVLSIEVEIFQGHEEGT